MAINQEWEAWQAYTVGNRKEIGVSYLYVDTASGREFVSAHMGDGSHYIFRASHPQYEEIKAKAAQINPENK